MKLPARDLNFIEKRLASLACFCRNLFHRILGNALFWNHENESMQVMHGLHKLILWTSMMAKGAKQDVYWWKKTGFTSSDYSFKERESSLIWIVQGNLLTFQCDINCIPHHQSVYGMQRKIYNLCMNHDM